jgi:hypothetical protein
MSEKITNISGFLVSVILAGLAVAAIVYAMVTGIVGSPF